MIKKALIYSLTGLLVHSCFIPNSYRSLVWYPKSNPEDSKYLDTIPFINHFGWIQIEAEIEGVKGKYILDNGASTTLDFYRMQEFENNIKTKPKRKESDTFSFSAFPLLRHPNANRINEFKIGETTFKKVGAKSIDFLWFSNVTRCFNYKGIIGANVMKDGVWHISHSTNTIIFSNDIKNIEINNKYAFKMETLGRMKNPIIELPIGDTVFKALVDLGNSGPALIMPKKCVREYATIIEPINISTYTTLMHYPTPPKTFGEEKSVVMQLSTDAFEKPITFYAYDNFNLSHREFDYFDVILGHFFLKKFDITFDWPNKMVYFEPLSSEFQNPFEEATNFNIGFFNYDKKVYVMGVFPNHCDTSLVSVADTVKAINGKLIEEIVGDNSCDFFTGEKSLLPKTDESIKILLKDKTGKEKMAEMRKVKLFE